MTDRFPVQKSLTTEALARGLSTVPRWNGRTVLDRVGHRFSVLQHSLVVASLVPPGPVTQLYAYLHDAEEAFIGDTPRVHKTDEQRTYGREVRAEVFNALRIPVPTYDGNVWTAVKEADELALEAECTILVHPSARHVDPNTVDPYALDQVWGILDLSPRQAIEHYVDALEKLFEHSAVKTLRSRS